MIADAGAGTFDVAEGFDRLPVRMAAQLGGVARYGARVTAVHATKDDVLVTWRGVAGQQTERADYVVVTVPVPVLRGIIFYPNLPRPKVKAMRAVSYLPGVVTACQFTERFWEDAPYSIKDGGTTCTDLPVRQIGYPTHAPDGTVRGVLRAQQMWAPEAWTWAAMSPAQRIEQMLRDVTAIHPGAADLFEFGISYDWLGDELALGAVALFAPEDQDGLIAALAEPSGRVMFAGEHTSARWHGTVEGAMESGARAAGEVHAAAP